MTYEKTFCFMELQRKYGMQLRRFTPRMKIHQKILKLKVFSIIYVKEDMFVTRYFNTLTHHKQQFDMFEEHDWDDLEDGTRYKKIIEERRIFKFFYETS